MIIGRDFVDEYYEDEKLYSTGDDYLDDLLEKAFCEGYEYAQKEFGNKQNKEAQRKWRQNGGIEEVSRVYRERMRNSPADYAVNSNAYNRFRESIDNKSKSEAEQLSDKLLNTKITGRDSKYLRLSNEVNDKLRNQTQRSTPKAIIKEQVGNIKKGVQKVRNSIGSRVKGVVKKITKKI